MGAQVYEGEVETPAAGPQPYEGDIDQNPTHDPRLAKEAIGAGAGAGLGALVVGALARRWFPGVGTRGQVEKNFITRLNKAIKIKRSDSDILKETRRYEDFVRQNGPVTPLQWLALHGTSDTDKVIHDVLGKSGMEKRIGESLLPKADDNTADLKALYGTAFADKGPIQHTDLLDILKRHQPAMQGALADALESYKYDPNFKIPMVNVPVKPRSDAWKWEQWRTVPPYLHFQDPKAGLQKAVVPNIETLDRMKRALWTLAEKRGKAGEGDVGAIHAARRDLTDFLDQYGPPEYRQARAMAQTDFENEAAEKLGEKILRQNPAYLEQTMQDLKPNERQALVRGAAQAKFGKRLPAENEGPVVIKPEMRERVGVDSKTGSGGRGLLEPLNYMLFRAPLWPHWGWPSTRGSKVGTDLLLKDPKDFSAAVRKSEVPTQWRNVARDAAEWSGYGALGGLGLHGLSDFASGLQPDDIRPPLDQGIP